MIRKSLLDRSRTLSKLGAEGGLKKRISPKFIGSVCEIWWRVYLELGIIALARRKTVKAFIKFNLRFLMYTFK